MNGYSCGYDRSKQVVRSLRKERDDLQEAFDVLLQKVEVCNNYTSWPFPRIHMANGAAPALSFDPVDTASQQRTPGIQQNTEAAYNSSMIATLRRERDEARTERDLVVNESRNSLDIQAHTKGKIDQEMDPGLSGEDALRIFRYNTAKNMTVEKEVNRLRKRLETPPGDHGAPSSQRSRPDASTQIPKASPSSTPKVVDEFDREVQDLASKLEAFRLEKAKLLDLISASKQETKQAATSTEASGTSPDPGISEPTPTREELQVAYSESLQRAETLTRENERLMQLLGAKDVSVRHSSLCPLPNIHNAIGQGDTNSPEEIVPDIPVPSDDDGEQSMEMATPLFPSTIVLRPLSSSSRTTSTSRSRSTSTRASPRSQIHSSSSPDAEVDPSSIMLPPSPLIDFDLEQEGSQPFQSTPPPFLAPRPPTERSGSLNLDWERGPTPSPDVFDPDKTIGLNLGSLSSPIPGPSAQPSASPFIRNASPGEQVARLEAELTEAERKLKVGEEAVDELKGLIEDLMRFSPS
ncbi:hypothetical protein VNI00_009460 [Paramarasmius palmivorus]|uniref:Uncharacterized protein n=1 Tax=Paramarasmius palmivorus TaxID=297713 RepID=A0AAW0CLW7_9AGAR